MRCCLPVLQTNLPRCRAAILAHGPLGSLMAHRILDILLGQTSHLLFHPLDILVAHGLVLHSMIQCILPSCMVSFSDACKQAPQAAVLPSSMQCMCPVSMDRPQSCIAKFQAAWQHPMQQCCIPSLHNNLLGCTVDLHDAGQPCYAARQPANAAINAAWQAAGFHVACHSQILQGTFNAAVKHSMLHGTNPYCMAAVNAAMQHSKLQVCLPSCMATFQTALQFSCCRAQGSLQCCRACFKDARHPSMMQCNMSRQHNCKASFLLPGSMQRCSAA